MSNRLTDKAVHAYAEEIAQRGCADVNRLLEEIDKGAEVPEIAHLDAEQQKQVLIELRAVMAVYDQCETDSK